MRTGSLCQTEKRHAKPHKPAPECIVRSAHDDTKGGTLLASDVLETSAHRKRLADPDGYRPSCCPQCGHAKLHVHDYRSRVLRAHRDVPEVLIVRYRCAACHATFRMLPGFIARHLWRSLHTIAEETLDQNPSPTRAPVPARTIHRWNARLASQLGPLHAILQEANHPLASFVQPDSSRRTLVEMHRAAGNENAASILIAVASLVHALDPTQRLL